MREAARFGVDVLKAFQNHGTLNQIGLGQLPDLQEGTILGLVGQRTHTLEGFDDKALYHVLIGELGNVEERTIKSKEGTRTFYKVAFPVVANIQFTPNPTSGKRAKNLAELVYQLADEMEHAKELHDLRAGVGYNTTHSIPEDREDGYVGVLHSDAKRFILHIDKALRQTESEPQYNPQQEDTPRSRGYTVTVDGKTFRVPPGRNARIRGGRNITIIGE